MLGVTSRPTRTFNTTGTLKNFGRFDRRTFWLVSACAALVLAAVVGVPQWLAREARLETLRLHVAEIARLAATVVDGDLHRRLLDPSKHTPELHEHVLEPLAGLRSAVPELVNVYSLVERDGEAYFVLVPQTAAKPETNQDEQTFKMEPFRPSGVALDANWLERIIAGEAYVFPGFRQEGGVYVLTGHAPIYDSQGHQSGFVGVDFDVHQYLAQEASFKPIWIGSLAAALTCAFLIGYLAARHPTAAGAKLAQLPATTRDDLTSLLNRSGALAAMKNALKVRASSYAFLLIDVDDIKKVNNTQGHAAGDEVLCQVAEAMRTSVRETDVCARLGGDEFLIFAAGCDTDAATEIARRVLGKLYSAERDGSAPSLGVSIGICVAGKSNASFDTLYGRADQALSRAKASGKNRFAIYDDSADA